MGYALGLGPLGDAVGEVPDGSNIVLLGPPMSRKSELARSLMRQALERGEGAIYITTSDTGERIMAWFAANGFDLAKHGDAFGIIDCVSSAVNLGPEPRLDPAIRPVNGPMDISGISIEVTDLLNSLWRREGHRVWLFIDSLSIILMYSNLPTVFRFLHVLASTVRRVDAVGVYIVEEGMHDEQALVTLKQLAQAALEVRLSGDSPSIRAVGLTPAPTAWFGLGVEGARAVVREAGP